MREVIERTRKVRRAQFFDERKSLFRSLDSRPAFSDTSAATSAGAMRFELATPSDDEALRALLRETPIPGMAEVAFLREPSYFRAAAVAGTHVQTLVARAGGQIAAVSTRAIRPTFINGRRTDAGYLGDLRVRPEFRGTTLLARGYRFLRRLHDDGRARLYSTMIMEGNRNALSTIAANRADLPCYSDQGRVFTPMLHVRRSRRVNLARSETLERGRPETLDEIVAALNRDRLQFAPAYSRHDFLGGRYANFSVEDFFVLRRTGRIVAVAGLWDQRPARQTVVTRYCGALKALRPLVNLLRRPKLPQPHTPWNYAYVAFAYSRDTESFRKILRSIHNHVGGVGLEDGRCSDIDFLIIGLHEDDPRAAVLSEFRTTPFSGRLFAVTFDAPLPFDGRTPFVEAALL